MTIHDHPITINTMTDLEEAIAAKALGGYDSSMCYVCKAHLPAIFWISPRNNHSTWNSIITERDQDTYSKEIALAKPWKPVYIFNFPM